MKQQILIFLVVLSGQFHYPLWAAECSDTIDKMQEYLYEKQAIMSDYHKALSKQDVRAAKKAGNRLKHFTFTKVALVKDYTRLKRRGCDFSTLCDATREICNG